MDYGGGVETIKRQARAAYGWLVVGQSVDAGLTYYLYASSVCDMNSAAAAVVCGLWYCTSVICFCLALLTYFLTGCKNRRQAGCEGQPSARVRGGAS